MARIHEQMIAAMREIPSIAKDRKNQGQGYQFRGIDDVYLAVSPVLAKHGIYMSAEILSEHREERASKSGGVLASCTLRVRYSFTSEDGSSVATEAIGEGMDSGDKAAAKAMSIAQKYAVLQAFLIPTADPKDPECDDPEPEPKPKARTPEEEKLAERYKFVLKAHAKIGPKVCNGIFEDVAEWNGGRKDEATIKAWETVLDAWSDGLAASQEQVLALFKGLKPGDVRGLDRRVADLAAKQLPPGDDGPPANADAWEKGRE
jgi:hypothetical protein